MDSKRFLKEQDLMALAKRFRIKAGIKRAQAAREMKVTQTSIFNAEQNPNQSLMSLRIRMIETYSPYKVAGPLYLLEPQK